MINYKIVMRPDGFWSFLFDWILFLFYMRPSKCVVCQERADIFAKDLFYNADMVLCKNCYTAKVDRGAIS